MKPSCEDTGRPNAGKLTLAAKYAVVFHLSEGVTYLQLRRHGSHVNGYSQYFTFGPRIVC
jgi:hypothetical protein